MSFFETEIGEHGVDIFVGILLVAVGAILRFLGVTKTDDQRGFNGDLNALSLVVVGVAVTQVEGVQTGVDVDHPLVDAQVGTVDHQDAVGTTSSRCTSWGDGQARTETVAAGVALQFAPGVLGDVGADGGGDAVGRGEPQLHPEALIPVIQVLAVVISKAIVGKEYASTRMEPEASRVSSAIAGATKARTIKTTNNFFICCPP
jgi:hypothetical protein